MLRYMITVLLTFAISACASPSTAIPTVVSTKALQAPVPSDWVGAITQTDDTSKSIIVHFTSEDGANLTGLLTLPATPGSYPAIMMLHGSEPRTKDNFGNQQMSAFMA
jgi:dipeptidyl aminopeptidase/acylaminoacyl peptidase